VSDLNAFINTAQQFTAPPDAIPVTDHSQQMSVAMELASRAANRPPEPPAPPPMAPIIAVAN